MLSKETVGDESVCRIEMVNDGIGILGEGGGENGEFVVGGEGA